MASNAQPAEPTDDARSAVEAELARIEESCIYSSQSQFSQAKLWRAANLTLGVLATALAAAAGGGTLANILGKTQAALIALAAAVAGAVMTSVNANRRAEQAHISANAYLSLQADARMMRTIDLPGMDFDGARSRLAELSARRDEINKAAEIPFTVAYWLGKLNVRRGATRYEVDKNSPN
jgi:hypothetical protein